MLNRLNKTQLHF